jgi:hypothetical protein
MNRTVEFVIRLVLAYLLLLVAVDELAPVVGGWRLAALVAAALAVGALAMGWRTRLTAGVLAVVVSAAALAFHSPFGWMLAAGLLALVIRRDCDDSLGTCTGGSRP